MKRSASAEARAFEETWEVHTRLKVRLRESSSILGDGHWIVTAVYAVRISQHASLKCVRARSLKLGVAMCAHFSLAEFRRLFRPVETA